MKGKPCHKEKYSYFIIAKMLNARKEEVYLKAGL